MKLNVSMGSHANAVNFPNFPSFKGNTKGITRRASVTGIVKMVVLLMSVWFGGASLYGFEFGVTGGVLTNTDGSGFNYGLSASSGLLIPMLKLEVEYYRLKTPDLNTPPETGTAANIPFKQNTLTTGVKFRPKVGRISPYVIAGVGMEFEKLGFQLSKFNKFAFFGGGVMVKLKAMVSLRADIRFLNFSDGTKTRISGGVFVSL